MTEKKTILIVGDNPDSFSGFARNGRGIAWSLADEYNVVYLGLQNYVERKLDITINNETRSILMIPNLPRDENAPMQIFGNRPDFGRLSLPNALLRYAPAVLLTINDIQMIEHVPNTLCPTTISLQIATLPSKKAFSEYALQKQLEGQIEKWKERYPSKTRWVALTPHDGEEPLEQWGTIYKSADKILAMSKFGRHLFKKHYDMDVDYIYHGVDTSFFFDVGKAEELNDYFVIGCNERNQPRKQPLKIMEAFAKFAKDKSDVRLAMQMDWHDRFGWPIDIYAYKFGIQDKIFQPFPFPANDEMLRVFKSMCDVHVNATAGEGFGLNTIEAFSTSRPMILTDYTTSEELILDGAPTPRGKLVPYIDKIYMHPMIAAVPRAIIDVNKLAEAFEYYYENMEKAKEHGKNAREWVEKNASWEIIQYKWKKHIEELIK